MKPSMKILTACLAALLAQACTTDGTNRDISGVSADAKPAAVVAVEKTQILVTFNDERVNRVPIADAVNTYRARGSYSNSTYSERVAESLAETYGLSQVAQWPVTTLGVHCVVYEVPAKSTDDVMKRLGADPRVGVVQTMNQFHVMNSPSAKSYTDPYYKLQSGLHEMQLNDIHREVTGRNVKIAVIDTGVDVDHQDLSGQLDRSENYVPKSGDSDGNVHGTAVAGIIAAIANNGRGIVGIAPDAKLISLKACWQEKAGQPEAECNSFTLALALNNAILMKPQILNMSLSGPEDPLLSLLIQKAMDEGIIVVASVPSKQASNNAFPASMKGVIGVQSVPGDSIYSGKSGTRVIAAPGNEILTTMPHDGYSFMTGSSFAAANVSGVIALLLEKRPRLNSAQVYDILKRSAENSGDSHSINVCNAVAQVGASSPGCGFSRTSAGGKKTSGLFASDTPS